MMEEAAERLHAPEQANARAQASHSASTALASRSRVTAIVPTCYTRKTVAGFGLVRHLGRAVLQCTSRGRLAKSALHKLITCADLPRCKKRRK